MKKTQILSLLLILILAFTLVACKEKTVDSDPIQETSPEVTADLTPIDAGEGGTLVTTLDEFIAAIQPNATVIIASGGITLADSVYYENGAWQTDYYDNPDAESTAQPTGAYVSWSDGWNGSGLMISDVPNLTIRGETERARIISNDQYAYVLSFDGCDNLTIDNIVAGHDVPGYCAGGVFRIENSRYVTITNTEMYGCGTEGLYLEDVRDMTVTNSTIYECTYDLMTVIDCKNITFSHTIFRDTGEFDLICVYDSDNIVFENCEFAGNFITDSEYFDYYLFYTDYVSSVSVNNSIFRNNNIKYLSEDYRIPFTNCIFTNNTFDDNGHFEGDLYVSDREDELPAGPEILTNEEIAEELKGSWVCTTVEYMNSNVVSYPADKGIEAFLKIGDNRNLDFYYFDGKSTTTKVRGRYTPDYSESNTWTDGTYLGWRVLFENPYAETFEILKYNGKLQVYQYDNGYIRDGWSIMLSFENFDYGYPSEEIEKLELQSTTEVVAIVLLDPTTETLQSTLAPEKLGNATTDLQNIVIYSRRSNVEVEIQKGGFNAYSQWIPTTSYQPYTLNMFGMVSYQIGIPAGGITTAMKITFTDECGERTTHYYPLRMDQTGKTIFIESYKPSPLIAGAI